MNMEKLMQAGPGLSGETGQGPSGTGRQDGYGNRWWRHGYGGNERPSGGAQGQYRAGGN